MNDEIEKNIILDYLNGKTLNYLRNNYNIGFKRLNKILENNNIEKRKIGFHFIGKNNPNYREFNDRETYDIIVKYKNKEIKVHDILKEYKMNFRTLNSILNKNNIKLRRENILENQYIENNIIEGYNNNLTFRQLTKKYSISFKTLYKIFDKYDIEIPLSPFGKKHNRQYQIDGDIFKRRDNETAYFCGLLASDGTISGKSGNVKLSMIDYEVIYNFCKFLELPESRIHRVIKKSEKWNLKPQYRLDIAHYNFLEDLKYWGVTPNKTYEYKEPKISDDLLASYIRGVFDGDGCAVFNKKNNNPIFFQITGNNKSLEYYKNSLEKLGINYNIKLRRTTEIHGVLYIGTQKALREVFQLLKGIPHLSRKWNKINKWLEENEK